MSLRQTFISRVIHTWKIEIIILVNFSTQINAIQQFNSKINQTNIHFYIKAQTIILLEWDIIKRQFKIHIQLI